MAHGGEGGDWRLGDKSSQFSDLVKRFTGCPKFRFPFIEFSAIICFNVNQIILFSGESPRPYDRARCG